MYEGLSVISNWLGSSSINIFGPPFSGKDTQAKRLAELFDGSVVAGGDILRHNHGNTEVDRIMAEGGVIPSNLFLDIVPPFFENTSTSNKPLFLSSVGRLLDEISVIEAAAKDAGHPIKLAILLQLSEAGVRKHFTHAQQLRDRGIRSDDNPEVLKTRLNEFKRTAPVIDYYRVKGSLIEIDDSKSTEEVTADIVEALLKRASG